MSFHEKSTWAMALVLIAGAAYYFNMVAAMSAEIGEVAPPVLPIVIGYVVAIIILSILSHILIAIARPSEADDRMDERDRIIAAKAGSFGGVLLGGGVVIALGYYLFSYDGNLLFHFVFGALMAAQIGEYGARIFHYRRGA